MTVEGTKGTIKGLKTESKVESWLISFVLYIGIGWCTLRGEDQTDTGRRGTVVVISFVIGLRKGKKVIFRKDEKTHGNVEMV